MTSWGLTGSRPGTAASSAPIGWAIPMLFGHDRLRRRGQPHALEATGRVCSAGVDPHGGRSTPSIAWATLYDTDKGIGRR